MIFNRSFRKVLSFTFVTTYNRARAIADGILVALIKYDGANNTYSSSIYRTFNAMVDIWLEKRGYDPVYDDESRIMKYKITIYEMYGNRRSFLSASQNPIYDEIIATKEMTEILERLGIDKVK